MSLVATDLYIPRDGESQLEHSGSPVALPALIRIEQSVPAGLMENSISVATANTAQATTPEEMDAELVSAVISTHARPSVINLGAVSTANTASTPTDVTPTGHTPLTPDPTHNGERPERMREWLVRMINSGRFPGLQWMDQEKMVFRVPWVHAKKRDYNQERDAALFREWAIHSGKYGDGSDVTTWKINFRCALNGLKDIIERKELEGPDCRVYQMLPYSGTGRRRKRRRPIIHYSEMMNLPLTESRNIRPHLDLPLGGAGTPAPPTPTTPITNLSTTPIQLVPIVTGPPPGGTMHFPIPVATIQPSPTTPHQIQLTGALSPTILPGYKPIVPATIKPVLSQAPGPNDRIQTVVVEGKMRGSISGTSEESIDRTPEAPKAYFSPPASLTSPFSPKQEKNSLVMYPPLRTGNVLWPPAEFADNVNALTLRVMYGSITVHVETVDCSEGCRIFYGPLHCRDMLPAEEEEKLFGPLKAHQIAISPRHPSSLASEIFKTMKRGFVVDVEDKDIYATALCRAVVYHGNSPMKHTTTLEKEERVRVFEYSNKFVPALRQHTTEGRPNAPKPYTIFSFGQPWSSDRPLSKNLITLVVTHCKALNDLRVRNVPIHDELLFESMENQDIRIISPTQRDLEAEEFLNPSSAPSTPL